MLELASLCPLQLPKRMSLLQCLRVNRDKCMHRIYDHIWCDRMCRLSSTFQAKRKTNKKRGLLIGSDTEGCREHKVAYSLRFAALLLAMDLATIWFRTFLSGDSRRSISTDYSGHSSDGSDRQHAKSFQGVVAIHFKQVKCRLLKLLVSWKGWTSEWRGTRVAGSTWNSWNQGWYIPGMSWEATSNTYKGITVSQPLQPVLLPGVDRPLVVRWNRARRGSTSGEICSQYGCSQHYWMVFNFKHQLFSSFQQMVGGCPSLGPVTGIPFTIAISQGACFSMGPVMGSDSPVVFVVSSGRILRHPDIAQLKRTKRLGGFGVHCELPGCFWEVGRASNFARKIQIWSCDPSCCAEHGEARRGEEVKDVGRGVGKYNTDRYQVEYIKMIQDANTH